MSLAIDRPGLCGSCRSIFSVTGKGKDRLLGRAGGGFDTARCCDGGAEDGVEDAVGLGAVCSLRCIVFRQQARHGDEVTIVIALEQ